MQQKDIHARFLQAEIDCADAGATAKDLHDYLQVAAKGMSYNAAFCMSAERLAEVLREEQ